MPADIREEDRAIMQLADELASMKGRMDLLEDGARASQLKYSSIEDGSIAVFDREGLERLRLGLQPDGSFTSSSRNNPDPPPIPRPPLLTPGMGTVKIQSQGSIQENGAWPADFSHLNVYASINAGPQARVGTIAVDPGLYVLGPLPYEPIEVWFTAVNHSGRESSASASATATPVKAVAGDILEGAITALHLAEEAVTRAKIAAGAIGPVQLDNDAVRNEHIQAGSITGEEIRANTVTALNIVARTITGLQIEAETILGEHIAARQIDANKLIALSITADEIKANAITAGKILAGSVTADKLEAVLVLATTIIAGNPLGGRVVLSQNGIDAFSPAGIRTFQVDAPTGDVRMSGIMETGIDGSIVRVTPGDPTHPLQTPGVYIYADGSNFPALIYATPVGSALGVRPSALQIIASLDDTAAAGHLSLRDLGVQMQYARMNTAGTLNELRPVGGYVQAIADAASMLVMDAGGLGEIDGGYVGVTRSDSQFGFTKGGGSTGGSLVWGQYGHLAVYGRLQASLADANAGIIMMIFEAQNATTFNLSYGVPDAGYDPTLGRFVLAQFEGGVPNYVWTNSQSANGCSVKMAQTQAGTCYIHIISMAIGLQ
jgi:hypothetical protein